MEAFFSDLEAFDKSLHFSKAGIAKLQGSARMAQALVPFLGNEPLNLEEAEAESAWAKSETAAGFPTLHAFATITLWALLESLVRELLTTWLNREQHLLGAKIFSKIRVPLSDVLPLQGDERGEYLASIVERELGAGLKKGVARFESLLEPFGLAGSVDERTKSLIFELAQIRNNIVHRAMIVDKQLVKCCPNLNLKAGERLKLDQNLYRQYFLAVNDYLLTIIVRVGEYYELDMQETRDVLGQY
jgi:hypothetical protein